MPQLTGVARRQDSASSLASKRMTRFGRLLECQSVPGGSNNSRRSVLCRRDIGRASFAGDAPCALTKVAVKSARRRPGKNVRAPAHRDSIQANAIPCENTLKHSVTEMFFLILACCQDRGGSGPGPAGRPKIGGPWARRLATALL